MAFGEIDELLAVMHPAFGIDAAQVRVTVLFEMQSSLAMRSPVRPLRARGRTSASRGESPALFADLAARGIEAIERDGNLRER